MTILLDGSNCGNIIITQPTNIPEIWGNQCIFSAVSVVFLLIVFFSFPKFLLNNPRVCKLFVGRRVYDVDIQWKTPVVSAYFKVFSVEFDGFLLQTIRQRKISFYFLASVLWCLIYEIETVDSYTRLYQIVSHVLCIWIHLRDVRFRFFIRYSLAS